MSYHVHQLNQKSTIKFLNEKRIDPITKETFKEGDKIVFCAKCKTAYLESSWNYLGNNCCSQSLTIARFPESVSQELHFTKTDNLKATSSVRTSNSKGIHWVVYGFALIGLFFLGKYVFNQFIESKPQEIIYNNSNNLEKSYFLNKKYLNSKDLWGLSKVELGIMRNEIFARHGYRFKSKRYKEHFGKQVWYRNILETTSLISESQVNNSLNQFEKFNIQIIQDFESAENASINDPDGYTNIRDRKSSKGQIIGKVFGNEHFKVIPSKSKWKKVYTQNGLEGYMFYNRIELSD